MTATPSTDTFLGGLRVIGRRAERVLLVCYQPAGESLRLAARLQSQSDYAVSVLNLSTQPQQALAEACMSDPGGPSRRFDVLVLADASGLLAQVQRQWGGFDGIRVLLGSASTAASASFDAVLPMNVETAAFDARLGSLLEARGRSAQPMATSPAAGRNVLLLVHHRPRQDPRLNWIAGAAPAPLIVHQLGMHAAEDGGAGTELHPAGGLVQSLPRGKYVAGEVLHWRARIAARAPAAISAIERLQWMEHTAWMAEREFAAVIGTWAFDYRALSLQWLFRYVLDLTATLLRHASAMRQVDAIVAADVLVLPAAYLLGELFQVPVAFDAHEYWPEADLAAADFERQFWREFEAQMVPYAQLRMTVSSGLAALMQREYGVPFLVVPNAEPRSAMVPEPRVREPRSRCEFLLQGGFAPGRGFELLIEAWPRVHESAALCLRGPDNEYRQSMIELARGTGLLDTRVFFPPAVSESELVAAASSADVGLLPYEPIGNNHVHCCPNKLSQYMAAGLPILANRTEFVREVVEAAGAGLVLDFRDQDALVAAINRLTLDPDLRRGLSASGREYFARSFHWEALSAQFYRDLSATCGTGPVRQLQVFELRYGLGDNEVFAAQRAAQKLEASQQAAHGGRWRRRLLRAWGIMPEPAKWLVRTLLGRT